MSRCLQIAGLKAKYIGRPVAFRMGSDSAQQQLFLTSANPLAGPGNEDKDAASVRADYPVPADLGLYYFEVTVVNKGRDGFIGQQNLLPLAKLHVFVGMFKLRTRLQASASAQQM